ncbi:formyltransferase family protein [Flagellimonas sp. CMM7]|uniref:formyltransferase family protein n=1 Tax=Flagellimonas sp. CMM7 TaxID=2654676 RepID=UPI0013D352E0|nr:formyltransferase family protein [Flagellimonas sp. CMM7]UII81567.1 hypothetical protein LV704_08625 [Flagellimonas sp. CMM7]
MKEPINKKILFLGYRPYLSSILYQLNGTPFLRENSIDIIFATPSSKSLFQSFKKIISGRKFMRALREFMIKTDNLIYANQKKEILKTIFPEKDLSFLNKKINISIFPFRGLENLDNLEEYDFLIVASFGIKIPKDIFNKPKGRTLNIHPSYLPGLRGGYPTYVEAFKNEIFSGTTIHYMESGWDNGDIVLQERYKVQNTPTNQKRMHLSASTASKMLNDLHKNGFQLTTIKQDKSKASYCHKIVRYKSFLGDIDQNLEGYVRANHSRSLYPFTYGFYRGFLVSILNIQLFSDNNESTGYKFFRKKNILFLKHNGKLYLVTEYIYKGKMHKHYEKAKNDLIV